MEFLENRDKAYGERNDDFPAVHQVSRQDGVRDHRYKLIHFYGPGGNYEELYDLRKDPDELNNVAGRKKYRKVEARLREALAKDRLEQSVFEY
ncbi:MAG: DUF4976 domain-containing protein [Bacteroidales bacterium]|nr:DUF4976 domain-containing protein [Bacteroidales bacterium]